MIACRGGLGHQIHLAVPLPQLQKVDGQAIESRAVEGEAELSGAFGQATTDPRRIHFRQESRQKLNRSARPRAGMTQEDLPVRTATELAWAVSPSRFASIWIWSASASSASRL